MLSWGQIGDCAVCQRETNFGPGRRQHLYWECKLSKTLLLEIWFWNGYDPLHFICPLNPITCKKSYQLNLMQREFRLNLTAEEEFNDTGKCYHGDLMNCNRCRKISHMIPVCLEVAKKYRVSQKKLWIVNYSPPEMITVPSNSIAPQDSFLVPFVTSCIHFCQFSR